MKMKIIPAAANAMSLARGAPATGVSPLAPKVSIELLPQPSYIRIKKVMNNARPPTPRSRLERTLEGEAPVENPSSICADGVDLGDLAVFMNATQVADTVAACERIIEYCKAFEQDSEDCQVEEWERSCCPGPVENPCTLCSDGVNLDAYAAFVDEFELADTVAGCEQIVEGLKAFEQDSQVCQQEQAELELSCCPAPVENPCTICADGITIDQSLIIFNEDTPDFTEHESKCQDAMALALTTKKDSDECKEVELYLGALCCPSQADIPCPITCPDGLIFSKTSVLDVLSCGTVVAAIEIFSEMCSLANEDEDILNGCCVSASTAGSVQSVDVPANPTEAPDSSTTSSPPTSQPLAAADEPIADGKEDPINTASALSGNIMLYLSSMLLVLLV